MQIITLACLRHKVRPSVVFPLVNQLARSFSSDLQAPAKFSKKHSHRISSFVKNMAAKGNAAALALEPLRMAVKEQGDLVRSMKESSAPEVDVKNAVRKLKELKKKLDDEEIAIGPKDLVFERTKLEDLLKRRFFYDNSFAIYGGISGQFDMGPMGCSVKTNLINAWRSHFILEEQLLEVDCTILTPEPVLKASGHVDRFADFMVKDVKTGECFRLDHLIKGHLEKLSKDKKTPAEQVAAIEKIVSQLDGMTKDEMTQVLRKYDMKSPVTKNELTDAIEFNLMFNTAIGPGGGIKAFLRPETAQGIFVNFKRLLDFNQGKLPFGVAQVGNAFRNEISPRSGLIRVREFTMAEIEYFLDPSNKNHAKFDSVKDIQLNLHSADDQMDGKSPELVALGDAVSRGLIANETLAYFMARIHLFLIKAGVDPLRLKFRQHMKNEMAHYACDCWDAECLTSYGWIECVGCADRSCYDLEQHTKATGVKLVAEKELPAPKEVTVREVQPNKGLIGKQFKGDAKVITTALEKLSIEEIDQVDAKLTATGSYNLLVSPEKDFPLTKEHLSVKLVTKTVHVEEIVPSVIEPSFGLGRIMYAIFEHAFKQRDGDEKRTYLALPTIICPYKCSILPLSSKPEFNAFIKQISVALTAENISHKIDDSSGSVGRRYARTDEIAVPFGITIDFDTLTINPPSVTLRERDSMQQVRLPISEVAKVVADLSSSKYDWAAVVSKYQLFTQQESKS